MKKNRIQFIVILLLVLFSSISGQTVAVEYDTLVAHTNWGVLNSVSCFETIRNEDSLSEYFRKIGYDDTLQSSKKPDFDSEMVIAVVTAFFGGDLGNVEYHYEIKRITEGSDSIIVEIHHDSLIYTTEIQHAYSILMLTIPLSGKPVFFQVDNPSSVQKSGGHTVKRIISTYSPINARRFYGINGRVLKQNRIYGKHIVVVTTPYGNTTDVYLQERTDRINCVK